MAIIKATTHSPPLTHADVKEYVHPQQLPKAVYPSGGW